MIFKDTATYDKDTKTAIIMRDGVYTYLGQELQAMSPNPLEDDKKYRVWRSPESVKAAYKRFLELGKIPVIFQHPDEDLDRDDFAQGYGYNPELVEEGGRLTIKCKLHLEDASKDAYEELGIREISCGWHGDFEEAKEANAPYDFEQKFLDFNHIALVPEGRCGALCSIKDAKGEKTMGKEAETKALILKAGKFADEIAEIAKSSKEIEDSHAEGLLAAIKGLEDTISGLKAFAEQENKEPELKDETETVETEKVVDEEVKTEEVKDEQTDLDKEDERVGEDEHLELEKDKEVKDEDVDKRQLLREVDAIAMKPASEFDGGEEEKFRTITKKLEELGYNKSLRGTANDSCKDAKGRVLDAATKKYLDKAINDATELGMKIAVKRFHDVLPFIADGTIPMESIEKGATPCEIKQKFIEEKTGKVYKDAKSLNVAFDLVTKAAFAEAWKIKDSKFSANVVDEKADFISKIGTNREGK